MSDHSITWNGITITEYRLADEDRAWRERERAKAIADLRRAGYVVLEPTREAASIAQNPEFGPVPVSGVTRLTTQELLPE